MKPSLDTATLLRAQYNNAVIVPVDQVCKDYFSHLSPVKFIQKVRAGKIPLALVPVDASSQKSPRGVHLRDLAEHIDKQHARAKKEMEPARRRGESMV
jgi:hypothetical protein